MAEPARTQSADLGRLRIQRDDGADTPRSTLPKIAAGVVLLVVLAGGGWFAWERWLRPAPKVTVTRVVTPAAASAAKSVDASGYLVPQKRAEVATKGAGIVAKVFVDEGDTVTEKQPLAVLQNEAEIAAVAEAKIACEEAEAMRSSAARALEEMAEQKTGLERAIEETAAQIVTAGHALEEERARLVEARRDYDRKVELRKTGDVGEAEVDAADAARRALEARVEGAQSGIAAAEARGEQAKSNLKAATSRWEMMDSDRKAADSRRQAADTRLKQAQIRLDDMTIVSPIAGRITSRKIHPGEAASPAGITTGTRGGALFTVADFSTIEAEVDINEARLSELKVGHAAKVAVDAIPRRRYRGELRQIVPTADRQRAVVKVKVRILDPDDQLMPEMGCRVTFMEDAEADAPEAFPEISSAAVLRGQGAPFVWIVVDGKVTRRELQLGEEKEGRITVKAGLTGGELIVTGNAVPMSEGLKVTAEEK